MNSSQINGNFHYCVLEGLEMYYHPTFFYVRAPIRDFIILILWLKSKIFWALRGSIKRKASRVCKPYVYGFSKS